MTAPVISLIGAIGTVGVLFFMVTYLFTQNRKGGIDGMKESNDILRGLNNDLKAALLDQQTKHQAELVAMRNSHDKEIAALQTQITALQVQTKTLEQANQVLQNLTTGRDTLLNLQSMLEEFRPYIAAFSQFMENDQAVLAKLDNIIKLVNK